jgi:hypothetical protein
MAVIAFDTLGCARRLQAAGFSAQQAEAQAEIMAETFVLNAEALVTRDYLDARLEACEERVNGKLRLLFWSQGLVVAVVLIPTLRDILGS